MRALDRPTRQGGVRQLTHVVLHRDLVLGPQASNDLQALLEPPYPMALRYVERIELDIAIAQPHAEHEVTPPDDVERSHAFRYLDRVVQSEQQDTPGPRHGSGLGGEPGQERNELELAHPFAEIVLAGGDGVPAPIAGQARHEVLPFLGCDHVAAQRMLIRQEDADLHNGLLWYAGR